MDALSATAEQAAGQRVRQPHFPAARLAVPLGEGFTVGVVLLQPQPGWLAKAVGGEQQALGVHPAGFMAESRS
ncbi:hypothetical protein D3C81_2002270 [compost metagenome]